MSNYSMYYQTQVFPIHKTIISLNLQLHHLVRYQFDALQVIIHIAMLFIQVGLASPFSTYILDEQPLFH